MSMSFNRNFSIGRVVRRLLYTILALYVGGFIMTEFGNVMNGTCSPFYKGLSLIGWTIGSGAAALTNGCASNVNTITATDQAGVLAVVGIIGIGSIVMEFISFR